jgi:hypothetical protein
MEPVIWKAAYLGGFKGMRPHPEATLTVEEERFTLERPKKFVSMRTLVKVWAKWSAVTALDVEPSGDGSVLLLTTKARGTGRVALTEGPEAVWVALREFPTVAAQFPEAVEGEAESGDEGEPEGEGEADPEGVAETGPASAGDEDPPQATPDG